MGPQSVLVIGDSIVKIGPVDRHALDALAIEYDAVDASGMLVVPGFVDPHQHLLGGSGEGGLALQTPMLFVSEIARAGVTTVVGVLGVDTTMKTISGLLGHVKGLRADGLSAFMWTGGYNVPPTTILDSVRHDLMFIDECIGAGEIAVSDERGLNQSEQELAKLVREAHVGGLLTGKSGVTHFHVGEEPTRLQPLRTLVDDYQCKPSWLYPTHVQRNERLLDEAIALARAGATIDFDVVQQDLAHWFRYYANHDAPLDRLTVSSDSDSSTPDIWFNQVRGLVVDQGYSIETILPLVTCNSARVLGLSGKGRLAAGLDADIVVLDKGSLDICEVIARGRRLVADGKVVVRERFLEKSSRMYLLHGDKAPERIAVHKA